MTPEKLFDRPPGTVPLCPQVAFLSTAEEVCLCYTSVSGDDIGRFNLSGDPQTVAEKALKPERGKTVKVTHACLSVSLFPGVVRDARNAFCGVYYLQVGRPHVFDDSPTALDTLCVLCRQYGPPPWKTPVLLDVIPMTDDRGVSFNTLVPSDCTGN